MANTKLKPAETSITDGHSDACWSRLIAASPFAAHMLPPTMVGGGYQITFSVYAGGTYTPQRTESLAGPWIDLPNGDTQWKRNGTLLAQTCQQSVRSVARFLVFGLFGSDDEAIQNPGESSGCLGSEHNDFGDLTHATG